MDYEERNIILAWLAGVVGIVGGLAFVFSRVATEESFEPTQREIQTCEIEAYDHIYQQELDSNRLE